MDTEYLRTTKLIAEAHAGGRDAYDQLFQTYRSYLQRQLRVNRRALAAARVEASDVVQDSLVDAIQNFQGFEYLGRGSFRRWLKRILENRLRMTLRHVHSKKRDPRREELTLSELTSNEQSTMPARRSPRDASSPSAGLLRIERRARIELALESLAPDYREVVRLVKLRELSMAEVARAMGRSENAVKKLLARALLQLRRDLDEPSECGGG